jgi:hypothetical protein
MMRMLSLWSLVLAAGLAAAGLAAAGLAAAGEPTTVPFPVDWSGPADSPASVAFLLDAPAGRDGFISVRDGHLVQPNGKRFRIWGLNITARACFPTHEAAQQVARHLARCGVNCVRLHFLDSVAPRGLIAAGRDDSRSLDAAQFDRLDYFIAELKKCGIYTNLNLNVGRIYRPGDGVADCELLGFAKGLTYFDPRLLELQREYARQLLAHRNAYTGHEYRVEPAVATVELVNENSLVESWFSGRLLGKNTRKNPGTWTDIPAAYEQKLTQLFNEWLAKRLSPEALARLRDEARVPAGAALPRLKPAEFAAASHDRFHTEATFYMELEQRYFDEMARFLRDELGVRPPVAGTSDHNHGKSGYPLLTSTSRLDIVDGHTYWQHPKYLTDVKSGRRTGFEIPNTPMVNDPAHGNPVKLSRTAVAGKPYTVSEVNHPFPHEYACEGLPILAAYAAFQDWDGVYWYTLAHDDLVGGEPRAIGHFDLGPDPVKMTQLAAGAIVFLRGDVRPATQTVVRNYSREQVIESLRLPWSASPFFTPGFSPLTPLMHATRIGSLDGPPTTAGGSVSGEPVVSDTGELRWFGAGQKPGAVVLDTPRSQALVGFCRDNHQTTSQLAADVQNAFCAITLSALDDRPIATAGRLLLTAAARVANTGMEWNEKRTGLERWGTAPPRIEPVVGRIVLRGLAGAVQVSAQPLTATGRPQGAPVSAESAPEGWRLPIGEPPTTWYAITVQRETP